jgi:tetratricopeptide (TPR) repeat protein
MYTNLNKVIEFYPNLANTHYTKVMIAVWTEWDWETGEKEYKKALELNPNYALNRIFYAQLQMILQRSEEALTQARLAVELDPMRPLILGLYAIVLYDIGNYQSAIKQCEKALSIDPGNAVANAALTNSYHLIGDYQKVIEMLERRYLSNRFPGDENLNSTSKKAFEEHGYYAAFKF